MCVVVDIERALERAHIQKIYLGMMEIIRKFDATLVYRNSRHSAQYFPLCFRSRENMLGGEVNKNIAARDD